MANTEFYDHICQKECRNTHHKLVMNSLRHLSCSHAQQWRDLFIKHFELYLEGSKAPDKKFKDFRNHVLHVSDNFWGGPVKQAEKWYAQTVLHLKKEQWSKAVYAAGVLSHYYMDPFMPLHTGQTEEEGAIHRACEWSVNKSFKPLIDLLESTTGYPTVKLPNGDDWLKIAIHQGAATAHQHYQAYIDHYDLAVGSKNPPAGLDDHLKNVTAQLLGLTAVGFARVLEKAFHESGALPAGQSGFLQRMFYRVTQPVAWIYKAFGHASGKRVVAKIAAEHKAKGKVISALPIDEKAVRTAHAREILKIDLTELNERPAKPIGTKNASRQNSAARSQPDSGRRRGPGQAQQPSARQNGGGITFRLNVDQPIEAAPSIGAKTARRFEKINLHTVSDLLSANPQQTAAAINIRHIQADTIVMWQTQARLACEIPQIYGHDAQILAGCGFRSGQEVATAEPQMILSLVGEYAKREESKFVMRGKKPDLKEVTNWVTWSQKSRNVRAA